MVLSANAVDYVPINRELFMAKWLQRIKLSRESLVLFVPILLEGILTLLVSLSALPEALEVHTSIGTKVRIVALVIFLAIAIFLLNVKIIRKIYEKSSSSPIFLHGDVEAKVRISAEIINSSSEKLAASSNKILFGAQMQTMATDGFKEQINQVSGSVEKVTQVAENVQAESQSAQDLSTHGGELVSNVSVKMEEIVNVMQHASGRMDARNRLVPPQVQSIFSTQYAPH